MALPADVEASILDWIGAALTGDEDLEDAWLRAGSAEGAALSILRRRRATAGPRSFSLADDYAENDGGDRVAWLDDQIARLENLTGDATSALPNLTVTPLARVGPTR